MSYKVFFHLAVNGLASISIHSLSSVFVFSALRICLCDCQLCMCVFVCALVLSVDG